MLPVPPMDSLLVLVSSTRISSYSLLIVLPPGQFWVLGYCGALKTGGCSRYMVLSFFDGCSGTVVLSSILAVLVIWRSPSLVAAPARWCSPFLWLLGYPWHSPLSWLLRICGALSYLGCSGMLS